MLSFMCNRLLVYSVRCTNVVLKQGMWTSQAPSFTRQDQRVVYKVFSYLECEAHAICRPTYVYLRQYSVCGPHGRNLKLSLVLFHDTCAMGRVRAWCNSAVRVGFASLRTWRVRLQESSEMWNWQGVGVSWMSVRTCGFSLMIGQRQK
jgi:hypothetical protein